MQSTAVLQKIDGMRFNVGPMSNQLTALGDKKCGFSEDDSRGVGAAAAASAHTGHTEANGK